MKYNRKNILKTSSRLKYVFFWGHQPSKSGLVTKSCFSQWWVSAFSVEGITYLTAEHYMMAEKARVFDDQEILEKILDCKSAPAAKKLGRQVKNFNQETWESKRYKIVKDASFHKFDQNESLKSYLLSTKKRILVEASPVDSIWGIGLAEDHNDAENPKKWKGQNLLGFALMEIRDELNEQ